MLRQVRRELVQPVEKPVVPTLPSSSPAFMQPIAGRKSYTVQPGDSLSKIAAAKLGSADRWPEIWNLNRDRVANENLIYPKLVLLMP